jgi:hypothetical protein
MQPSSKTSRARWPATSRTSRAADAWRREARFTRRREGRHQRARSCVASGRGFGVPPPLAARQLKSLAGTPGSSLSGTASVAAPRQQPPDPRGAQPYGPPPRSSGDRATLGTRPPPNRARLRYCARTPSACKTPSAVHYAAIYSLRMTRQASSSRLSTKRVPAAGARSEPAPLLHPWKAGSDRFAIAFHGGCCTNPAARVGTVNLQRALDSGTAGDGGTRGRHRSRGPLLAIPTPSDLCATASMHLGSRSPDAPGRPRRQRATVRGEAPEAASFRQRAAVSTCAPAGRPGQASAEGRMRRSLMGQSATGGPSMSRGAGRWAPYSPGHG